MTYVKIGETLYPATINGVLIDRAWGGRDCKAITAEMDYATANALFVDELDWSIVMVNQVGVAQTDGEGNPVLDEQGQPVVDIVEEREEYDNSEYCVAGSITDNRNGTVTVKMGKPTDAELLAIIMGGKSV